MKTCLVVLTFVSKIKSKSMVQQEEIRLEFNGGRTRDASNFVIKIAVAGRFSVGLSLYKGGSHF